MAIVLLPSYEVWRSNRGLSIVMDIPSTMWQIWPSVLAKEVISIIMLMTSDHEWLAFGLSNWAASRVRSASQRLLPTT